MIWNNIPEETVCFDMVLLKQILNEQIILLLKHVQKSVVLLLSKETLIGAIGQVKLREMTTSHDQSIVKFTRYAARKKVFSPKNFHQKKYVFPEQ